VSERGGGGESGECAEHKWGFPVDYKNLSEASTAG
jgi:hypothetical protein